jgi:hypothetical protein
MKNLRYIDAKKELPSPDFLDETCNGKYLVVTENGLQLCMFCQNEHDELDWYTNYSAKLITHVRGWYKEVDEVEKSNLSINLDFVESYCKRFFNPFGGNTYKMAIHSFVETYNVHITHGKEDN